MHLYGICAGYDRCCDWIIVTWSLGIPRINSYNLALGDISFNGVNVGLFM